MRFCGFLLGVATMAACCLPAFAGNIFGRHKPNPAERVPQLVVIVKSEPDEDKRGNAVRELRNYDPNAFPDIIPALIDVLQHDAKPSVRAEAATSLSKLRPISQQVGWALEEATKDSSIRVRFTARNVLMSYRIGGYRSSGSPDASTPASQQTSGPTRGLLSIFQSKPEAQPQTVSGAATSTAIHRAGETPPPPLATDPPSAPAPRPLPPPLVPASQPKPAQPIEQGPDLPSN
jgi:hypothetical protein